jgi:hypothetical protein
LDYPARAERIFSILCLEFFGTSAFRQAAGLILLSVALEELAGKVVVLSDNYLEKSKEWGRCSTVMAGTATIFLEESNLLIVRRTAGQQPDVRVNWDVVSRFKKRKSFQEELKVLRPLWLEKENQAEHLK